MPDTPVPIKVFFACPSYSKHPCYEFSRSSRAVQRLLDLYQIPSVWCELGGDPYIHKVRNRFAAKFIDDFKDCTHFFFWDDDVGTETPEAVIRFLQYPFDVVCGIYPKKEDELNFPVELTFEKTDDGTVRPIVEQGCYLANLAPTGFMCVQRRVLEAAAADSLEYEEPDRDSPTGSIRCYDIFRTGTIPYTENSKKGRWWGEDYFFCAIAKSLGFSVWVDPDIEFSHRGSYAWKANFSDTLQDRVVRSTRIQKAHTNEVYITEQGEPSCSDLAASVYSAFHAPSPVGFEPVHAIYGMSGRKFREFLNSLVARVDAPRYLEIGTYKGSTAISALYGNVDAWATLIDNWSRFGYQRDELLANLAKYVGGSLPWALIEKDYKRVDYTKLGSSHNIYFFDGPHTREDQLRAVTIALPALTNPWIYIVDDWNVKMVREGTFGAIYANGFEVLYSIEIRTTLDNSEQPTDHNSAWHNGTYIAVLRRKE